MKLNDYIEKGNELYDKALKTKDVARSSDNNINSFMQAADYYKQAADIIFNNILTSNDIDFDSKIQSSALAHYYRFEENECLYSYNYKNAIFTKAISYANNAQNEIEQALSVIDNNINSLKKETYEFLIKMQKNWKSSSISIKIKQLEPIAKKAMNDRDYIKAFDTFNQMLKIQKELYEYDEAANLEQVYIRIAKGNYIGMSANVNQAMAGILADKISNQTFDFDLTNDLLKHFLNSLDLSFNAFKANPEWDKYRSGAEIIRSNIQSLLKENKDNWFKYLTNNINNQYLISIMQQIDNDLYKRQKAKVEIENNGLKRILISGGFWFGIFIGLGYFLLQVASSDISWFRFITIMFCLPLFFIVIGAFALKTTNSLKEENFMRLMELTIKINFKGLKVLSDKNETN